MTFQYVNAKVIALRHDAKVLWSIIGWIAVNMVNNLVCPQEPTKLLLHYEAIAEHVHTRVVRVWMVGPVQKNSTVLNG